MNLSLPDPSLVALVGPTGAGKSTFARRHFKATEIVSSDHCRALVSDDENAQWASPAAFELVYLIVRKRLTYGRLAVVDATNVLPSYRRPLLEIAREVGVPAVAIVFDFPEEVCQQRNLQRRDRRLAPEVISRHHRQMRRSLPFLHEEGFKKVWHLGSPQAVEAARILRRRRPRKVAPNAELHRESG